MVQQVIQRKYSDELPSIDTSVIDLNLFTELTLRHSIVLAQLPKTIKDHLNSINTYLAG